MVQTALYRTSKYYTNSKTSTMDELKYSSQ